jgi:hypothetical protein
MSSDTSTSQRSRSAVLHEVAQAIRQYRDAPDADGKLADAARLLCDDTRQRALPVERAIVDLKAALLAEVPDLTPGDSLSKLRQRVVLMTIEEYYRARPPS